MFSDSRCKNACKMLADLCPCFHQSSTRPNFGRSRVKLCPILCRLRTKLCPNFGCSRARLCPIYFAPCPFPNLAGTLRTPFYTIAAVTDAAFPFAQNRLGSNVAMGDAEKEAEKMTIHQVSYPAYDIEQCR